MSEPSYEVWPGVPYPLGATPDAQGVNFAVYSERAQRVQLCLFDARDPSRETHRLELTDITHHVWHGYVPGLRPGVLYGFRVYGRYAPEQGLRFNPAKLLLDPYARAITGKVDEKAPVFGYPLGHEEGDLARDDRDDAAAVPKSVVVDDAFDWGDDRRPGTLWRRTVIYELHVKGFTAQHPELPPELRGTYAGLAHPAVIRHLQELGVTAVELLPVHESVDEGFLADRGLTNYWGYNTLGFFAPEQRYASSGSRGEQVREFKQMVKALHSAGIEVLLDVVFNHTAEGSERGPTLSFRGLDNATYYWLSPEHPRHCMDFTGCGNTVNVKHPQVLKLVADSLRYWATEMRVDGFRFDLATALGRTGDGGFDRWAPFFQVLHQDPVLSRLKLIAEPWDLGPDGYKPANFPVMWAEWNGRYRDTIRRFWKGDDGHVAEVGYRLTGSSDLFKLSGRRPTSSVNFVTCHDGFTLHDLVSYNHKHNEANGEENRDGANDNHSWNCGVEGETDDVGVRALRERQKRNLLTTLLLSQGTPMLCAGDEMGRTQRGNNNAYCQDNPISWVDWSLDPERRALLAFTQRLVRLRREHPVLQRRNFFLGANIGDSHFKDLVWFRPDGTEMTPEDWNAPQVRSLQYLLGGDAIAARDPQGGRIRSETLLVMLNAHHRPVPFALPAVEWGERWEGVLDTSRPDAEHPVSSAGGGVEVAERSIQLWARRPP